MRLRLVAAFLAAAALIACGNGDTASDNDNPGSPSASVPTPTPVPTPAPVVRLTIAAYNAAGDLVDEWPRGATSTLEAVPACATEAQLSGERTAPRRVKVLRQLLGDDCKPPAYVDWDLSGAACELRGDRNSPSVRVQCSTSGELRTDAVSRAARAGTELGRGSAQFRVLP